MSDEDVIVELFPGRTRSLRDLIENWEKHVRRLEVGSEMPIGQYAWGAYDH